MSGRTPASLASFAIRVRAPPRRATLAVPRAPTPARRRAAPRRDYSWKTASENLLLVVSMTWTVSRAVWVGSTVLSVGGRPASVTT